MAVKVRLQASLAAGRTTCTFILAGALATAVGNHAAAQSTDETPSGMVAFFMMSGATCPTGWAIPQAAQGRLLLGVTDSSRVGGTVGTPLGDQAQPLHLHTFQTTLPAAGAGIDANYCCNDIGAQSGTYTVPDDAPGKTNGGQTDSANLPFIQLLVCQKQ
jgi:hypothetical protein